MMMKQDLSLLISNSKLKSFIQKFLGKGSGSIMGSFIDHIINISKWICEGKYVKFKNY